MTAKKLGGAKVAFLEEQDDTFDLDDSPFCGGCGAYWEHCICGDELDNAEYDYEDDLDFVADDYEEDQPW
jgi:hypothetical protein